MQLIPANKQGSEFRQGLQTTPQQGGGGEREREQDRERERVRELDASIKINLSLPRDYIQKACTTVYRMKVCIMNVSLLLSTETQY